MLLPEGLMLHARFTSCIKLIKKQTCQGLNTIKKGLVKLLLCCMLISFALLRA